jgi:hypothetical protein
MSKKLFSIAIAIILGCIAFNVTFLILYFLSAMLSGFLQALVFWGGMLFALIVAIITIRLSYRHMRAMTNA